jgi:murE/murF fusion protein
LLKEIKFYLHTILFQKRKEVGCLNNNSQIIDLIKNDLNNNDYLMVKASNATGFNKIIREIKG